MIGIDEASAQAIIALGYRVQYGLNSILYPRRQQLMVYDTLRGYLKSIYPTRLFIRVFSQRINIYQHSTMCFCSSSTSSWEISTDGASVSISCILSKFHLPYEWYILWVLSGISPAFCYLRSNSSYPKRIIVAFTVLSSAISSYSE